MQRCCCCCKQGNPSQLGNDGLSSTSWTLDITSLSSASHNSFQEFLSVSAPEPRVAANPQRHRASSSVCQTITGRLHCAVSTHRLPSRKSRVRCYRARICQAPHTPRPCGAVRHTAFVLSLTCTPPPRLTAQSREAGMHSRVQPVARTMPGRLLRPRQQTHPSWPRPSASRQSEVGTGSTKPSSRVSSGPAGACRRVTGL